MKKQRAPTNIDKNIHRRMKLLKSRNKLAYKSITDFVNNALDEKLDHIENKLLYEQIRKHGFDASFDKAKELPKIKEEMHSLKEEQEKLWKEIIFRDAYYKILMIKSFDKDNTDEFKDKWIKKNIFSAINEDEYIEWVTQETKRQHKMFKNSIKKASKKTK